MKTNKNYEVWCIVLLSITCLYGEEKLINKQKLYNFVHARKSNQNFLKKPLFDIIQLSQILLKFNSIIYKSFKIEYWMRKYIVFTISYKIKQKY